jgi:hypothetical protein
MSDDGLRLGPARDDIVRAVDVERPLFALTDAD